MPEAPTEGLTPPVDPDQQRRWNAAVQAVESGHARFVSEDMIEFVPPGGFTPEQEARRFDAWLKLRDSYNGAFFADKRRQRAEAPTLKFL